MRKFLLMLMLLSTMMFSVALADTYGDFEYSNYYGDEITITAYNGNATHVVVPSTIDGYPVRHLAGDIFRNNSVVESVTLPDGLLTMDSGVFANATSIRTLVIPDSVIRCDPFCFAGMTSLESLTCPASCVSVNTNPWTCWWSSTDKPWNLKYLKVTGSGQIQQELCSDLQNLETVILGEGVTTTGHNAFADCPKLTTVQLPSTLTEITSQSFGGCTALTSINIPDGATKIGDFAFSDCTSLTSVRLPQTLTELGYSAFGGCTALRSLELPASLRIIGERAFASSGMTSMETPTGLVSLGKGAFDDMPNLKTLHVRSGLTTVTEDTFGYMANLETLTISANVETIESRGFVGYNFPKLTSLSLPTSIKTIDHSTFTGNQGLGPDLNLPNVTSIGESAFYGCSNLRTVTLGNSLTTIPGNAFYECTSLTTVTLGNSLTTIQDSAFCKCSALTTINIPASVTTIGYAVFSESGIREISLPGVTSMGHMVFNNCPNLATVTLGNSLTEIANQTFKDSPALTTVRLGNSVATIGEEAFQNCTSLTTVTFPSSLRTIGNWAFSNTGFVELTLPEGIETIGIYVFEDSARLRTLTLPNSITSTGANCLADLPALESLTCPTIVVSNEPWTCWWSATNKPWKLKTLHVTGGEGAIHQELCSDLEHLETVILGEGITETGHNAFADCPKLTNVQLPSTLTKISSQSFSSASSLRSIIIPANVTRVEDFAFSDCTSLSGISLPTGVTSIGNYAFLNCSSLRTFGFPSTLKSIGEWAFQRSGLTSVSLPDGLETMANGAFGDLESLTYLRVPGSLTEIPNGAFSNCPNLETLILCDGIEIIGDEAFIHAGENKSLNLRLPMTLRKIGTEALRDIGVSSIVLPNSLTTVNCYAITSSRSGTFTIYTSPSITEISQDGGWAPPFSYDNTTIWCVKNSAIHNYVKQPNGFTDARPTIKTYGSSNGVLHLLDAQTTLAPGATYTIPLVYANASMSRTFTSNNTAIATVNSEGVITAKGVGTTTITITGGGKTATFTVNVALPIDSVTLGFSQITVSVGDTFRIPVNVTPSSAASAWAPVATTSNAGTATVSGRVVTAVAAGSAEITLADPADNTKFVRLTVHVTGDSTLKLPSGATTVKSEAFSGIKAKCITVPASVKTISSRAFTGNTALKLVRFDGDTITIANDAFDGCSGYMFLCKKNSAAHTYAQQHGITCVFIP